MNRERLSILLDRAGLTLAVLIAVLGVLILALVILSSCGSDRLRDDP